MSLTGKRIVNTRAVHQAEAFHELLREAGAIPLEYPCIAIVPPEDSSDLDRALIGGTFDLLVLTSTNTVTFLAQRLHKLGASLDGIRTAAVGRATAQAAHEQLGVEVSIIPADYSAHALGEALATTLGMRILLPQSEIASTMLAERLMASGTDVTAIPVYRTIAGSGGVELALLLKRREVDAVTFTSSSTARFFVERLEIEGGELGDVPLVSIGSQTSQTIRELGLTVSVEAEKHTLDGLIDGLTAYFEEHS